MMVLLSFVFRRFFYTKEVETRPKIEEFSSQRIVKKRNVHAVAIRKAQYASLSWMKVPR